MAELNKKPLNIVMFPWLAFGHIIPFLELSKCLAQRGHKISFISTPRNLQRLPKIPSHLSHQYTLVTLPLPENENLPEHAEATTDCPHDKIQYLKVAFDGLSLPFAQYLETCDTSPDWIIHDFAHHWLPPIAAKFGIPCAYLSVFNASSMTFYGPPAVLMGEDGGSRSLPEHFTVPPPWVPFPSDIVFRPFEANKAFDIVENASGVSDSLRFGSVLKNTDAVFVRSCTEFEGEWFELLKNVVYKKPVIQMGSMLPPLPSEEEEKNEAWVEIKQWLEKQKEGSVVYVALGSEASLTQQGMHELATGLESSNLPFFWVIRKPLGSTQEDYFNTMLPSGFEDRVKDRGILWKGWVPQLRILSHLSVGGFLTHCGWGSTTEGLGLGKLLLLLPMLYDQGLVARLVHSRKIGLEIPRDERDGSFTRESVAESLRILMVGEESEKFKIKAREMKEVFTDMERQNGYIDDLERFMIDYGNGKINASSAVVDTTEPETAFTDDVECHLKEDMDAKIDGTDTNITTSKFEKIDVSVDAISNITKSPTVNNGMLKKLETA
ncbi:hypothetical protein C5167_037658 [Papaver somniferum]|uniref:Glycosyltransferase n=1 Tax=Papaver somniferum TaxID=3469 RepID=A0A4Y7I6Z6_PAPSO|nr:UDP-glycosyltransferase 91C1-like [Papaver somniferum]RZC44707.1 hypothetical protein C5167_037658 [Papaver somniferum]